MTDQRRIDLLRSALLSLLPQHVLVEGRCGCGDNCIHERALLTLDLTRPEHAFMVPSYASRVASKDAPSSHERTSPSADTLTTNRNAPTGD